MIPFIRRPTETERVLCNKIESGEKVLLKELINFIVENHSLFKKKKSNIITHVSYDKTVWKTKSSWIRVKLEVPGEFMGAFSYLYIKGKEYNISDNDDVRLLTALRKGIDEGSSGTNACFPEFTYRKSQNEKPKPDDAYLKLKAA